MMARRTFVRAAAGVLAALGLSSCEDTEAPRADLVAGVDLYEVGYSCGGGISGSSESIDLVRDERGGALLTWTYAETWNAREKSTEVRLDASAFDEFEQIAIDYDLRAASEQPDGELIALDADTTSVTFAYVDEDGGMDVDSMFTVSSVQDLTDEQREGFHAACAALKALVDNVR